MTTTSKTPKNRVFLIRHGRIDKLNQRYDKLNSEGLEVSKLLPKLLYKNNIKIINKYYDVGSEKEPKKLIKRCQNTLKYIDCKTEMPFGSRQLLRNLNAVLDFISTTEPADHLICYRSESIESGDLYHIKGFELHTDFYHKDYKNRVKKILAKGYDFIYQIEINSKGTWQQKNIISTNINF